MSLLQLSLRMMLWILFLAALAIGWGWERWGRLSEIEEKKKSAAFSLQVSTQEPSADAVTRRQKAEALARLSDEALREEGQNLATKQNYWRELEVVRSEIAKRGLVDDVRGIWEATKGKADSENVKELTLLRRAEKKPDPLAIEVLFVERDESGNPLPVLHVGAIVRNADVDRQEFRLLVGGDYRGGRRDRWRLELRDVQGRLLRDSNYMSLIGGGIGGWNDLKFGEEAQDRHLMDPRRYASPPPSGRYQLQLIHSDDSIAEEPDQTGLVVWKSKPIWVEVLNHEERAVDWTGVRLGMVIFLALAAFFICYWFSATNPEDGRRLFPWSDAVFCLIVVVSAFGWWWNDWELREEIVRLRPDAEAKWTIVAPQEDDASGKSAAAEASP